MESNQTERWLGMKDLCRYFSVSNDTIYRWINQGGFPAKKIMGRWKALKSEVEDWAQHAGHLGNEAPLLFPDEYMGIDLPWSVFTFPLPDELKCPYTHVSLFSGCGGIDLGFRQVGFKTVFANDINEDACATYEHNLGEITLGDIRNIELPEIDSPDVLTAGFPCQPFSNAGLRKGVDDERGDLYLFSLKAVEKLKPKVVLFENVRGLLSSKHNGQLLIEIIAENLYSLGYNVAFRLLDASQYNVGERRLRVLIVGTKRSDKKLGVYSFPEPNIRKELCLRNIVFNIPCTVANQGEVLPFSPQSEMLVSQIPEGGSWKDIPYNKLPERLKKIADNIKRYHSPKFYRRFHRDDIAGTITAAFTPEKAGIIHPVEHRFFSVREVARIQSFPDWFTFLGGSVKSKYQQIGNAVPPRLAYELALAIKAVLNGKNLLVGKRFIPFSRFKTQTTPVKVTDPQVIFNEK